MPKAAKPTVIKTFDGHRWDASRVIEGMDPSYVDFAYYPAAVAEELAYVLIGGIGETAMTPTGWGKLTPEQIQAVVDVEYYQMKAVGRIAPACRDLLLRAISEGMTADEFAQALTRLAYDWWPRLADLRASAEHKSRINASLEGAG